MGRRAGRSDRARELDSRRGAASPAIFGIMRPFQPAPPPEAPVVPFDWGDEQHVNELLGDAFDLDLAAGHLAASPSERRGVLAAVRDRATGRTRTLAGVARRRTAARSFIATWVDFARPSWRDERRDRARRASGCSCTGRAAERDRLAPRRGGDAPLGADPPRHASTRPGTRPARPSTCAATSRRTASPASCYARVPERANLVARDPGQRRRPDGSRSSRTPTRCSRDPAEWELDPWSGELRDGEIWGRGRART